MTRKTWPCLLLPLKKLPNCSVHRTSHILQFTRNKQPCLTGHLVRSSGWTRVLVLYCRSFKLLDYTRNQQTISGFSIVERVPVESRTNSHQTFDHHKCLKCKSNHKNDQNKKKIKLEFILYIYSNSEWKKYKFLNFKVIRSWVASKYTAEKA